MFMSADLTYHCLHTRVEDYRAVSHSVQLRKRYFSDILLHLELLFFPFKVDVWMFNVYLLFGWSKFNQN